MTKQLDKIKNSGTSLVVQWLGLCASSTGGAGSMPGRGAKELSSHMLCSQNNNNNNNKGPHDNINKNCIKNSAIYLFFASQVQFGNL